MKQMILTIILGLALVGFSDPANADPRGGDRGGWGGGGHRGGGGWNRGGGGTRYYHQNQRPGYRYRTGYGWYDPSAIIGGAIGGWLWRQWAQPEPEVVVVQPQEPVRGIEWCMNRYKSYDPYTKTYLGYDGLRHGCP